MLAGPAATRLTVTPAAAAAALALRACQWRPSCQIEVMDRVIVIKPSDIVLITLLTVIVLIMLPKRLYRALATKRD